MEKEYGLISIKSWLGDSDNDVEMLAGGLSIAMGNGTSRGKEVVKHTTTVIVRTDYKALEHLVFYEEKFVSSDHHFNKVKEFHGIMDECIAGRAHPVGQQRCRHRAASR